MTLRLLCTTAALAAIAAVSVPAQANALVCVTTTGNPYWEVCVQDNGCTVYVWSTMPPSICV